jgi:hypothetical protein
MDSKEYLTALASYCIEGKSIWASLSPEANNCAKGDFDLYARNWKKPWDCFIDIASKRLSEITSECFVSRNPDTNYQIVKIFNWYAKTWYICKK